MHNVASIVFLLLWPHICLPQPSRDELVNNVQDLAKSITTECARTVALPAFIKARSRDEAWVMTKSKEPPQCVKEIELAMLESISLLPKNEMSATTLGQEEARKKFESVSDNDLLAISRVGEDPILKNIFWRGYDQLVCAYLFAEGSNAEWFNKNAMDEFESLAKKQLKEFDDMMSTLSSADVGKFTAIARPALAAIRTSPLQSNVESLGLQMQIVAGRRWKEMKSRENAVRTACNSE